MADFTKFFPKQKQTEEEDTRETKRLAKIDTVAALASVIWDNKGKPPINSQTDLFAFAGTRAKGYGQVTFPLTEALAFAQGLDTIASGGSIQPEPISLATLTSVKSERRTMLQNLINATPYVGESGTVIGIKIAGSNWEGSSKPKGTLVALDGIATLCWYVSNFAHDHVDTSPADRKIFAALAAKHETQGEKVTKAFMAMAE